MGAGDPTIKGVIVGDDGRARRQRLHERRIRAADAMAMDMKPCMEAKGSQIGRAHV